MTVTGESAVAGQPDAGQPAAGQQAAGPAPGEQAAGEQAAGQPAAEQAAAEPEVSFDTDPGRYRHWKLAIDGSTATLSLDVAEDGGLVPGYELKMNSYDLGVDIELYDAVQRLRFEHPEVRAVVLTSLKDRMFCAGANIRMLAQSSHGWKVNFCKFTNETRNGIEDATANSGQTWVAALNGTASGGGYELALACDQILLADDGSSAVSLPELPLLAVLPGTGGLTRLVDKRMVRKDHADFFCTTAEGVRGKRAQQWRLVDRLIPASKLVDETKKIAEEIAAKSKRPKTGKGIALPPVERTFDGDTLRYPGLVVEIDGGISSSPLSTQARRSSRLYQRASAISSSST